NAYVNAVDQMRRAISPDEPYLILQLGEPTFVWMRFDLLPRRSIRVPDASWRPRNCLEAQVRWLLVGPARSQLPLLLARPRRGAPGLPAGALGGSDARTPRTRAG